LIPGIVELNGSVTNLQGTTLQVGGQTVDISGAHVSGTLAVGQVVRIYVVQAVPGVWTARSVIGSAVPLVVGTPEIVAPIATAEVAPPLATLEVIPPARTPEVGEDFKVEGTVQAFDANTITVDGNVYFIGSARIDDPLFVGAWVRLEIRVIRNGEWVVEEVNVRSGDSGDDND
jgi:hypothetical protein